MTRRVFLDMDGVVTDFDAGLREVRATMRDGLAISGDVVKKWVSWYQKLPPFPGAIEGVRSIIGMGFDVWLATKPPTGIAHAYGDKAAWVFKHLPELKRKLIITHDKGMLGGADDFLVDDRLHKANCEAFRGALVQFGGDEIHSAASMMVTGWPELLELLRASAPNSARKVA
jgi:hypothetical protein